MKALNFISIIAGVISCFVTWYFALFTNYLMGESIGDAIYLHIAVFVATHGFTISSILWYKNAYKSRYKNAYKSKEFYCRNIYTDRSSMKCTHQCAKCYESEIRIKSLK